MNKQGGMAEATDDPRIMELPPQFAREGCSWYVQVYCGPWSWEISECPQFRTKESAAAWLNQEEESQ